MLTSATMNKLYELRLAGMAESYRRQMEDIATFGALGFEERFGMMVDAEWGSKRSKRLATLIKNAGFHDGGACVENIEYHDDRKLDRGMIVRLSSCAYIEEHQNVILVGASGSGYTGVNGATCPMRWSRCSDESEPGFRRGSHCRKLPVRMKRRVQ